jgi:hypothetical protein
VSTFSVIGKPKAFTGKTLIVHFYTILVTLLATSNRPYGVNKKVVLGVDLF